MDSIEIFFWISLFIIFYSHLGYGIILVVLVLIKRAFFKKNFSKFTDLPEVTLFIPAYNEIDTIRQKVQNSKELDYPKDKLQIMFIDDGSNDGTYEALSDFEGIKVFRKTDRQGKISAINWGLKFVETPIIVFSDANTDLSKNAAKDIVSQFADLKTGCVSGEKRIIQNTADGASIAGEGLYWKYESFLKKMDSELYSVVGADGALFAVRKDLIDPVENDTILDDFVISLKIASKGYKIKYAPNSYAKEYASENVGEEWKRKVRISAGGIQSILRLLRLLNPFKYGILTFQYISHKVLRWSLCPLLLFLLLPVNVYLAVENNFDPLNIYTILLIFQMIFYILAALGWKMENKKVRVKVLFIPFYFTMMNLAVLFGMKRYFAGGQNVKWERAKRADHSN